MTVSSVIIVGAGPAGIGVASLLEQTGIDYVILEKKVIGTSFLKWPKRMEMITPSFPSNAFGQMDLNSICESTSPGFSFKKEHLTGKEYGEYLVSVVDYFNIKGQTNTEVQKVTKQKEGWRLETNQGSFYCKYLIWATGEFQNPKTSNILGSKYSIHSSSIKDCKSLKGDDFIVVGGYESGVQIAYELIENNKKVTVINPDKIDDKYTSDPSKVLSPYTHEKYQKIKSSQAYKEVLGEVTSISEKGSSYELLLADNTIIKTQNKPICATGFSLVIKPLEQLITYRKDGSPKLQEQSDESVSYTHLTLPTIYSV